MIWSNEEKREFSNAYIYTCKLYDKDIDFNTSKMILADLEDLSFENCMKALLEYRRNPKNRFWPKPNDIRGIISPIQSPETKANEAASRIREAISKFGWCNSLPAREYIGELGWKVVERSGGWQYVCENHGLDLNPLTYHAQARDLAKSLLESHSANKYDQPIGIPQPKEPSGLSPINDVLKLIPQRGENAGN